MIVSLDNLLVREIPDARFVAALRDGIARFEEYRGAIPLIARSYTRTRLLRSDDFELVAMQWAPGSKSPIHDHGDSRCWVVVLEGVLDVENYDRLDDGSGEVADIRFADAVRVGAGELDHRLSRKELHRVSNTAAQSTYTLQLYAAPISFYRTVDEGTRACGILEAKYDARYEF